MSLKLLRGGVEVLAVSPAELKLQKFCQDLPDSVTFEWINGQYWLHSDLPKERPIGIELDQELNRHLEYFKKSSLQKELLAKAIGVKGPLRPRVLDLTAGMLGDTLLFLAFGCEVISLERNPIISFLIQSAKENARHELLSNWTFLESDAAAVLNDLPSCDVIYFDPMFEDFNEKSSPRKEMRIFRNVIGQDLDAKAVFLKVRGLPVKRFVVKRPRLSEKLGDEEPLSFVGKATRYDVYLSQNHGLIKSNPLK